MTTPSPARILYDNAFSPFARKVRMVLDYKALAYEVVDALRPEARGDLAQVNPRLEVPVLVDGDVTVVNSSDIVAYLDHKYPASPVYPADPAARVKVRKWERLADTLLDAIIHDVSLWLWAYTEAADAPPTGLREAAAADLERIYLDLDRELAQGPFVCGELSVADFALLPHLSGVKMLGMPISAERHPQLLAWYQRMRQLPVVRADIARTKAFLALAAAGGGTGVERVVWRGDRIEWLLAHGFHEWFIEQILLDRVGWPPA